MRFVLHLSGTREIIRDTVEQGLHRRVLDRRAHEDRTELETDGCAPDSRSQLLVGGEFVRKHKVTDLLVDVGKGLDELLTLLLGKLEDGRGEFRDGCGM